VREEQARAALAAFDGVGVGRWIAAQRWNAVPGGWVVPEGFQGWRFRLEPVAGGVRVTGHMRKGAPALWFVPA
jgi:hypothetical protein